MRIVRYSTDGRTWFLGAEVGDKIVQLLAEDMLDFIRSGEEGLRAAREAAQAAVNGEAGNVVERDRARLGAPLINPPKLICIGLNYHDHVKEAKMQVPKEPVVFSKFASSIVGPDDPIEIPPITQQADYEVELAVVIGKGGRNIAEEDALDHVFGYTILNDMSARDLQFRDQWLKGKTLDTFAPLGPAVVTADAVGDPQSLRIYMKRNGNIVQDGSTRDMIFSVSYIIHYLSTLFTLEPGDVIATGTPFGVIMGQENPQWLAAGEVLEAGIEKIGVLRNPLVAV